MRETLVLIRLDSNKDAASRISSAISANMRKLIVELACITAVRTILASQQQNLASDESEPHL